MKAMAPPSRCSPSSAERPFKPFVTEWPYASEVSRRGAESAYDNTSRHSGVD